MTKFINQKMGNCLSTDEKPTVMPAGGGEFAKHNGHPGFCFIGSDSLPFHQSKNQHKTIFVVFSNK